MGTNYYLEEQPPCPHCKREYERLHIGKSSAGWCFALQALPERGINSLSDWLRLLLPDGKIKDEYGVDVTPVDMVLHITQRKGPGRFDVPESSISRVYSEPGPNGLWRSRIGEHCLAHGEGTWDMVPGDFS